MKRPGSPGGGDSVAFDTVRVVLGLLTLASVVRGARFDPASEDKNYYLKTRKEEILRYLSEERNCGLAKNIIFFIGDGMGKPIVVASRIYKGQSQGKPGEETLLAFEKFPYTGLISTFCVDRQVADSACTATSIFTGVNGMYYTVGLDGHGISGDCDGTMAHEDDFPTSIMTYAQKAGRKTGIVTTTRVTHATPAATYAHAAFRDWESDADMPPKITRCKDIARQLMEDDPGRNFNVILGGGRRYFESANMSEHGRRRDGRDLVGEWIQNCVDADKTFKYVTNAKQLNQAIKEKPDKLLGLFNPSHMQFEADRDQSDLGEPHIATMTEAAIEVLDNPEGFVLLVEGGRIDHALHDTNAKRAIIDLLAFEQAVETAIRMTNPQDTLIIVGADHSHVMTINGYPMRGNPILGIAEIQREYNLPYTTLSFSNGFGYNYEWNGTHVVWQDATNIDTEHLDYKQQSGTYQPDGHETHGGEDVSYWAQGPWAHLVSGSHHLSYIGHVAQFAGCLGEYASACRPKRRFNNPKRQVFDVTRRRDQC